MTLTASPPYLTGRDRSDGTNADGRSANADATENKAQANASYEFLKLVEMAEQRDTIFKGAIQKNNWRRAYDAFHNRHSSDSKYSDSAWRRKRTSLFRPKTRSAVRHAMAASAASLFTTSDVLSVQAEMQDDPTRSASAAIIQQLLNYRLDRTSGNSGIPWFMVTMGACLDGQITGINYTKQFWEYERVVERATEIVETQSFYRDSGEPIIDPVTGEIVTTKERREVEKEFVTKDRPQCLNVPPDNVMIDPAAYWVNPVQTSGYLILKFPMTYEDAKGMLRNPGKSNTQWLDVPDELLTSVVNEYSSKGVRLARAADRTDAYDNREGGAPNAGTGKNEIVWLYECFLRVDGTDYNFWSLGSRFYASQVRTTRQAYPEQRGERPVVRGYACLETHETFPMAPVLSWQEMQKELNDIVNLRLDTMKQALSPIAKVKQGSTFDFKQLHNRAGQDTTIIVRNMEDLEFDRSPDATASSYQETNFLNADFDDLAGLFSGGSVNTNRHLNETVGGLQLLSGSANAVTEFDLRVFNETWVEPALRQIVRLEQYYENDEVVLAIAGSRAQLLERFQVDHVTDEDLEREVTVRVNVGVGAADPMQRMTKLRLALSTLAPMMPYMDKQVKIKSEEIIKEIMGAAGFHDGMRFVELADMTQGGSDPKVQAEQMKAQLEQMRLQVEQQIAAAGNQNNLDLEKLRQQGALLQTLIKMQGDQQTARIDAQATAFGGMANTPANPPSESISFKDIPPEAQSQMLAQAGIHIPAAVLASHAKQQADQQAKAKAASRPSPSSASRPRIAAR